MRRENRKNNNKKKTNDKIITYGMIGAAILAIAIISVLTYKNSQDESEKYGNLENGKINNIANSNSTPDAKSASMDIGKSVNEIKTQNTTNTSNVTNSNSIATSTNTAANNNSKNVLNTDSDKKVNENVTSSKTQKSTTKSKNTNVTETESEKLSFIKPINGDISKDFAKEQLVYSNTLDEWTTHLGIDIKAEEGQEVNSAESGVVKSIKNDPRYGLTITIEHVDGYQSVYSNLLSSEAVVEGEKVEKGQVIATVGNTAAFETKEDSHLHFELLKDYEQVNPMEYIK